MLIAEVIVDVALMQTDQTYTYQVPEAFELIIQRGMRVVVPFGSGSRLIQGFVMQIRVVDGVDFKLKPIVELLDITPVLNEELLQLADFLKEATFSFKISCLQAMLPNLLKMNYDKEFVKKVTNDLTDELFGAEQVINWQIASERGLLTRLQKLRQEGSVELHYLIQEKGQAQFEKFILASSKKFLDQVILKSNAKRQRALWEVLYHATTVLSMQGLRQKGFKLAEVKQAQAKGWLKIEEREVYRNAFELSAFEKTEPLLLNDEQMTAFDKIKSALGSAKTFLLEGVTGSGKTEIYLQIIREVLVSGQTALMLVPEISLTPQMVTRFVGRFGKSVAVLHSGLSDGERFDEWRKIERGIARVVVGARSAIFAPLEKIGVIIIDEEHEASYKQSSMPRYHARDVAIERARFHQCPLILGSATPSLETRARAQKNVFELLKLTKRANPQAMLPDVEIVNFRDSFGEINSQNFTPILLEKIKERLAKKEQIVLLLNRRGYSSFVLCRDCGYVVPCPNCEISLTLHMDTRTMNCHYCGHKEAIPINCP
ncbi:MAG: primosomal protein N', partial [Streptococcaceae bacterium]|nr:primosomal protein N' [Streptococcaceae bacterium]